MPKKLSPDKIPPYNDKNMPEFIRTSPKWIKVS
jgi:hypothetical protein